MTTFAASLKKEIARVAKKELRDEFSALRKSSSNYRGEIAVCASSMQSSVSVSVPI